VGYAWLLAVALAFGLPMPPKGTNAHDLVEALGPIGTGIGLSFVAFLVGSFSDDLMEWVLRTRGQQTASEVSEMSPVLVIRKLEEWQVRSETERLEASIDRLNAEASLRVGLVPPVLLSGLAAARETSSWLSLFAAGLAVLLIAQAVRRRSRLRTLVRRNAEIGASVTEALRREPEALQELEERQREQERREEDWRVAHPPMPPMSQELLRELQAELPRIQAVFDELNSKPIGELTRDEAVELQRLMGWQLRLQSVELEQLRDQTTLLGEQHGAMTRVKVALNPTAKRVVS
jgi:hypothetical protein